MTSPARKPRSREVWWTIFLPVVTAVTKAECGGEGAGGGAGALISSPSPTYKVFVTGAAISVLSEVGLTPQGHCLAIELVTPAQCWSPQHSHMACKLQPGELLGGSSATSKSLPPSHQHQLPRLLTLASTVTATDCWGTVTV